MSCPPQALPAAVGGVSWLLWPASTSPVGYHKTLSWIPCTSPRASGLSESRRIARQHLAIRDSVEMSASAIRRFGDSVIPRIRGCQPDRAGPGAGATPHKRIGYTSSFSKANILSSSALQTAAAILLLSKHKQGSQQFQGLACCGSSSGCVVSGPLSLAQGS